MRKLILLDSKCLVLLVLRTSKDTVGSVKLVWKYNNGRKVKFHNEVSYTGQVFVLKYSFFKL